LIAAFCLYLCYLSVVKHFPIALLIFFPTLLFFGFLAFPWGRDQPTELWALAIFRFMFKPHRRIWNQSALKELVTITVPKKIERQLTNNLSPSEVEGRLRALANTLDSRGWVVKGLDVNLYGYRSPQVATDSDRLITLASLPHDVPDYDVRASDDVFDESSNPAYMQLNQMVTDSEQRHRQELINELSGTATQPAPQPETNQWVRQPPSVDQAGKEANDLALDQKLRDSAKGQKIANANLRTLEQAQAAAPTLPPTDDPAILSLAGRDDLNISTLAREADKSKDTKSTDEVVINLN